MLSLLSYCPTPLAFRKITSQTLAIRSASSNMYMSHQSTSFKSKLLNHLQIKKNQSTPTNKQISRPFSSGSIGKVNTNSNKYEINSNPPEPWASDDLIEVEKSEVRSHQSTNSQATLLRPKQLTGAFVNKWIEIFPAKTHYKRAFKKSKEIIKMDVSIKNVRNANRKYSAQFLDSMMKNLNKPITSIFEIYNKKIYELHPFEKTVADLTLIARAKSGKPKLEEILAILKSLRINTSKIAKEFASRASNANSAADAKQIMEDGTKALEEYYCTSPESIGLIYTMELHQEFRKIPVIDLNIPSIALVGAPNVGKSSIVRAVSSGTPEVNDYPFTTRGVTIGHIIDRTTGDKAQIMDTPGLLDRIDEERNEMEKLTFATLAHLPSAVIYVIDPTGLSGQKSTLDVQLAVRTYLKQRFPKRPWLDVVSKGDLPISPDVQAQLPPGHLVVSVKSGKNVPILKEVINDMIAYLRSVIHTIQQNQPMPTVFWHPNDDLIAQAIPHELDSTIIQPLKETTDELTYKETQVTTSTNKSSENNSQEKEINQLLTQLEKKLKAM